jgi:hypothetical protein
MQNALNESSSTTPKICPIVRESVEKALELLEDSPTGGIFEYMCVLSGVATEEELFSDYKLFESSLCKLFGDETANTILTFLHNGIENRKDNLYMDYQK